MKVITRKEDAVCVCLKCACRMGMGRMRKRERTQDKEWERICPPDDGLRRICFFFTPCTFVFVRVKYAVLRPTFEFSEFFGATSRTASWPRKWAGWKERTVSDPFNPAPPRPPPVSRLATFFSLVLFVSLKPEPGLLQRAISRLFKHKFTNLAWYCCIAASGTRRIYKYVMP